MMKFLLLLLLTFIFSDTVRQSSHPKCRGPASNYACEYFYDLADEEVPKAILEFLKKYSVSSAPADMHATDLFKLYAFFDVNIPGVDFEKNFVANIFVYKDDKGEEFVGYRDTGHEKSKDKKAGVYDHNKFSVAQLTSKAGADFVKYDSYFNLMRFNVKALDATNSR